MSDKSVKIPPAIVGLISSCIDEATASRVLWIVYKIITDSSYIPDMTAETDAVRALTSVAHGMLRKWEHRQEQNRSAWEAYKQREATKAEAEKPAEDACQCLPMLAKQQEREKQERREIPPTPPIREESKEESKEGEKKYKKENGHDDGRAESSALKECIDKAFARFWNLYPRKVGRKAAYTAFAAVFKEARKSERNDQFKAIIDAVNKSRVSYDWNKENGSFIPHPTTWLHQRRWEDEGIETAGMSADEPVNDEANKLAKKLMEDMRK